MRGLAVVVLVLGGCASRPLPPAAPDPVAPAPAFTASSSKDSPRYRCDNDMAFTVRFEDDSAIIDAGERGTLTLGRDAGGVTPSQVVYSNTSMKILFDGGEAQLQSITPPFTAHCRSGP